MRSVAPELVVWPASGGLVGLEQWMTRLSKCGARDVPPEVREGILAQGHRATPRLLGLVYSRAHAMDRVPAHAVELLGDLGDPRAAPFLVPLLQERRGDLDFYVNDALVRLGRLAVEPLLEVWESAPRLYGPVLIECAAGCADPRVVRVVEVMSEIEGEDLEYLRGRGMGPG